MVPQWVTCWDTLLGDLGIMGMEDGDQIILGPLEEALTVALTETKQVNHFFLNITHHLIVFYLLNK